MKRFLIVMLCAVVICPVVFAQGSKKKKETITFQIEGMHCENCVKKIEKNIAFEKGVTDLKCDLSKKTAEITFRADKTTPEKVASAFEKIGMKATPAGK